MEGQPSSSPPATFVSGRAEVDTSRPFRSVKEAVAVFGDQLLAGNAFSLPRKNNSTPRPLSSGLPPKQNSSASSSPPSYSSASHFIQERDDEIRILTFLKKLEAELKDTKQELLLLKERESETERAVAALNAQLKKSMSKLAEIEAAANAVESIEEQRSRVRSERWQEEGMKDLERSLEHLPTLAQAFSFGDLEDDFGGRRSTEMKVPKKKPIVPLVWDIFSKKKKKKKRSTYFNSSLYSGSFYSDLS